MYRIQCYPRCAVWRVVLGGHMNGDQQELIEGAAKKSRPRKPDFIYEGLCAAVFAKRWRDVRGMDKGRTQKAAEELRLKGLDPLDPKVVGEIQRRAQRWRQINERTPKYLGKLDNPVLLAGDWRLCEFKPTIQPGQPSRKEQAAADERYYAFCQRAYKWWDGLTEADRAGYRSKRPGGISNDQIAIAEYREQPYGHG